jgi:RNA polymerase sigma-70 factor (ECF subfamily)
MSAIEEIYRAYAPDVHRFAYWLCGDRAEAEDIVSETFVRAWAGADDLRAATVKAYLLTIARNLYLKRRRRASKQTAIDPALPDPGPDPSRRAEQQEEFDAVQRALACLPEVDRAALLMRVEEEMPYEEIARALGISLTAAKVKVHRARIRLAERCNR